MDGAGLLPIALIAALILLIATTGLLLLYRRFRTLVKAHTALEEQHRALRIRFRDVLDLEEEKRRITGEMEATKTQLELALRRLADERKEAEDERDRQKKAYRAEASSILEAIAKLKEELDALSEQAHLQEFGFYEPHYQFADSDRYREALDRTRDQQKQLIKQKRAAVCHTQWEVGGSKREGSKMINQRLRLMLRAFNGECDAAISSVRYNNVGVMENRIVKARETINKLSETTHCEITEDFYQLKRQELLLTYEYHEKRQAEKEEQRRIREEMREEERALKEMEKARRDAEKDERRYERALEKAREEVKQAVGEEKERLMSKLEELQRRLSEAHENKERAISRAQLTRSGHVYVISNIGSFGENVYKIGMTRRLEPMDRIRELGDASVPYRFDVHAIIYSEDAPALEAKLHSAFGDRRVNRVNERKEFFGISIDEIAKVVREHNADIEITKVAEAEEYRKTMALLKKQQKVSVADESKVDPILAALLQDAGRGPGDAAHPQA